MQAMQTKAARMQVPNILERHESADTQGDTMMTMQGSTKPLLRKGSHASTCNEGKGTVMPQSMHWPVLPPPKTGGTIQWQHANVGER
jgi:hypothetical protein